MLPGIVTVPRLVVGEAQQADYRNFFSDYVLPRIRGPQALDDLHHVPIIERNIDEAPPVTPRDR